MISADGQAAASAQVNVGIDLTPLIDIIFIVLVFLLLTANSQLLTLPVDVPTETDSTLTGLSQKQHISINILTDAPHWALDAKQFDNFDQFEAAFIQVLDASPDINVVVAADKNAPVQPLMTVLALLQRQQITNTQILMEP
jgi:biopolymer transport protein ExbD